MKVEFSTRKYEFSHGKTPRGTGGWGFYPVGNPDTVAFFYGSLTEAKRQAREWAREHSFTALEVAP